MADRANSFNSTRIVSAGSGDLFNGFFESGKKWNLQKEHLVDGRARRIFEMMAQACEFGVYPYQLPLEGRTGPWVKAEGRELLMLSSYDYLGLVGDPRIDDAAIKAIRKYGTGTGGARMLTGTNDLHHLLEQDVAAFKGTPEAVTFSSGYLANLAVITSLLTPQDRVVLDALSHRSLVDACRLAGVPLQRFRHSDMDSLRHELSIGAPANRTLIIADGVFSMDGDICPLPDLIEIKREFGCFLMIDDSHASGVLGRTGAVLTNTSVSRLATWISGAARLASRFPPTEASSLCSKELSIFLQHSAAPFIFSGALAPSPVAAARAGSRYLETRAGACRAARDNANFLRNGLRELGYDTGRSETPIIPIILKDERTAALMAGRLREMGLAVTPILFPAVPLGSARLRLCATAAHSIEDLEFALNAFREIR